jgi:hypothetical protein
MSPNDGAIAIFFYDSQERNIILADPHRLFRSRNNWQFSVRPIKDECGKVVIEWYLPGERLRLAWQPLEAVLERIRGMQSERE